MYINDNEKKAARQLYLFDFLAESKNETIFDYSVSYSDQLGGAMNALVDTFSEEDRDFLFYKPRTGRPGLTMYNVLCIIVFMSISECSTMRKCIKMVNENPNLRYAMDIDDRVNISESSVCRKSHTLIKRLDLDRSIQDYYLKTCNSDLICCGSIDSTIYKAREKAVGQLNYKEFKEKQAKEQEAKANKTKGHRGRYAVGSPEEAECKKRKKDALKQEQLERERLKSCTYEELAEELQRGCGWTAKKNSQGKFEWSRGYKCHFLADDNGCIAAYEITGANVADSAVSIALKKKCPIDYLYTVEDKGYDSPKLRNYADDTGHVAIIDRRNDTNCSKMPPFHREVYKKRTTVERSNGELKECFLPKDLHYRSSRLRFQFEISIFLFNMKRLQETSSETKAA